MSRITESNELIKRQITLHSEKLDTHEVKIVQVEHNLSDFSKAISQLNPNHEAKQSVSGFGVVSLPENAANSPLSVVVKANRLKSMEIFGVSWDKGENPTLSRTDSAVDLIANVGIDNETVENDFDNLPIWGEIHDVEDDYGNIMSRYPKFYIKKTDGENFKTWQVSKTKYKGFYLPWCFWDFENNRELPYIDIGKYKASLNDGKLESKSDVFPLRNKNIVDFRGYANENNTGGLKGYQQLDIHVIDLLRTLYFIEFATLNSQAKMLGYTDGQYLESHVATKDTISGNVFILANTYANLYRVGQYISIGTTLGGNQVAADRKIISIEVDDENNKAIEFDGASLNIASGNIIYNSVWKNGFSSGIAASSGSIVANDGKYPCMYRGIESPFGDTWQFVDGLNVNEWQSFVCKDASQYVSNVYTNQYEQLDYVNAISSNYAKTMGFDVNYPFAEIPTEVVSSGQTKYYCDYYYQASGQRIARFGGSWIDGAVAGLSSWNLSSASSTASLRLGGRLVKKPL